MKIDGVGIPDTLVERLLNNRIHRINTLLVGPPGTGKATLARRMALGGPFRCPHHTISEVAMIGSKRPGEYDLAHNGVLLLDELPEFRPAVLEALGNVIARQDPRVVDPLKVGPDNLVPVNTWIIGAMDHCACGYTGRPDHKCLCSENTRLLYNARATRAVKPFRFDTITLEYGTLDVRP